MKRNILVAVAAVLITATLVPAWWLGTTASDYATYNNNGEKNVHQIVIPQNNSYMPQEFTWRFSLEKNYPLLKVFQQVGMGLPSKELDRHEIVQLDLTHPGQHQVKTWFIEIGECHYPEGCESSNPEFPWGHEWIMIVDPEPGQYVVTVTPGPGRSKLPDGDFLSSGISATAYSIAEPVNVQGVRGNQIWWYYPDGSAKFVQDGGFIGSYQMGFVGAVAGVAIVIGLAGAITALVIAFRRPRAPRERATSEPPKPSFLPQSSQPPGPRSRNP